MYVRNRRVVVAAAAAALALVVTACSSDGDTGSSGSASGGGTTAAAGTTAKTPTGMPIKIGVPVDLSGAVSSLGPAYNTANGWGKWVNANGGINGHPVQVIAVDAASDPTKGTQAVKKLVEQDKIAVLVPLTTSEAAWLKYFEGTGVPAIGGALTNPDWFSGKFANLFALGFSVEQTNTIHVAEAKAQGSKKFGYIVCAEVPACKQLGDIAKVAAQKAGLNYAGTLTAAFASPSYTAQCLSMRSQGWDGAQLVTDDSVAVKVVKACVAQGFNPKFFFAEYGFNKDTTSQGVPVLYGAGQSFPYWVDAPFAKTFRDAMKKYATGNWESQYGALEWQSLELLRKALANIGDTITPQSVTDALYTIKNETLGGELVQPITYTKQSHSAPLKCYFAYQMKDKKLVDNGAKPICPS